MILRAVAMCDGKYIGIETIYTVTPDGRQINIKDKVEALRKKGRDNQLFCPCGCGTNLTVVASDKNLRAQHFREKGGTGTRDCTVAVESPMSIESKIVLKCWLDDKMQSDDLESRVSLDDVADTTRKPEFTFLSRKNKLGVRYWYTRANIEDTKLEAISSNLSDIRILYIVDYSNAGTNGQYPEALMKIQKKQKYCLLLRQFEADYSEAILSAIFYEQDLDGIWVETEFASDRLANVDIVNGVPYFAGTNIDELLNQERNKFFEEQELEKKRRIDEAKKADERRARILEEQKQRLQEEQRIRKAAEQKRKVEEEKRIADEKRAEAEFLKSLPDLLAQQKTPVRDERGNRWVRCEFCGKIEKESQFTSYGGANHVNLGTCKECSNNPEVQKKIQESQMLTQKDSIPNKPAYDPMKCPECGGRLRERSGRNGLFIGCSNYPECRYTRSTKRIW